MDAITEVLSARSGDDLFAGLSEPDRKKRFRKLARQVHPDRFGDDFKDRASEAFDKLTALWDEFHGKARKTAPSSYVLAAQNYTYVLGDIIHEDPASVFYSAEYRVGDDTEVATIRFARTPKDNPLLERHMNALNALDSVPEEYRKFFPVVLDTVKHRDSSTKQQRLVVVTQALRGFYSLGQLRRIRLQNHVPVDPKDMAWIFARLLVAVGNAHEVDRSCGAIFSDTVWVHPLLHGVVLTEWSESDTLTEELRVADIHAAADLMLTFTDDLPRPLRAFFNGCKLKKLPSAQQLLVEFYELIEDLYGQRRYRAFELPQDATTKGI